MHLGECGGLLCIVALTAINGINVRQDLSTAGSCPYNNLIIANGATYAPTVNGSCLKYTCNSGTLVESEFACHLDNRCFLEGQTYTKTCDEYKCTLIISPPLAYYSMVIGASGFVCLVWCSLLPGGQSTGAGRPCTIEGYTAEDGELFVLPDVSGPCIKYRCNDSSVYPDEYSCQREDGKCYPLDDTYSEGCITEKCQMEDGYIQYVIVNEGCQYKNTCVPVDGTINVGCQKYKCTKEVDGYSSSYSLDVVESACSYRGSCVAVGQTIQDGCNKYQCVKTVNNTVTTLSIKFVEGGCLKDGKCKPAGDSFLSSCIRKNCTVTDGTIGYVITGEGCQYKNNCYSVGTTAQDGCTSYLCSKQVNSTTTTYSLSVQQQKCEDANHKCQNPGSVFPYVINGVKYENCTCELKPGSTRAYSCYG